MERLDAASVYPRRRKAATIAAEQLRGAILRSEYEAGRPLPPERTLCQQLGVSRLTLRAALTRLESEGLVHPVQGSGTHVLDFREFGGIDLVGPMLAAAVGEGEARPDLLAEVLELRRSLALDAMELATARATEADFAALAAQIEQINEAKGDPDTLMHEDMRFARLLLRAAHNLPLELLYNTVARTLAQQEGGVILFMAPDPHATSTAYARLLTLLQTRDPARARRVARRLLERHDRDLLRSMSEPPEPCAEAAP
jgi:GntR family transcriptional repressor for pyruvate dehydrogenase complex